MLTLLIVYMLYRLHIGKLSVFAIGLDHDELSKTNKIIMQSADAKLVETNLPCDYRIKI